ncbi:diguanylate cyclase [Desulfonatronum sp. SC1]|uniref:diguanylate cyclase n=1 Tax=Desulfonatronum sp. SC1 TaxID=2109626 RepID=UPI000D3152A1|nr:diguanylate cyclase [Desulfonatronum sp. SC1]PTN37899.1 diguanylate cyclase response regulator [Desulfonatronum sp. SC1]
MDIQSQESRQKPVVLVVDDQKTVIHALAQLLREDYHVLVALSGAKALELASGETIPDLILMDVIMPDMDGYEVCKRLKNDPKTKGIPVIFVTAMGGGESEAKGLDLGAVDYIPKPFNNAVVKARVRTHVQLKIRTDMLEKLALVDGLTGIANRRSFDQALEQEWKRAARSGRDISVIMLDIDHFKAYNDNYGHGAGDDCLQRVAKALRSAVYRPSDLIARYGGEEFVALLPETDSHGAARLAETLRLTVANLALPHAYSPIVEHITVSVGHATRRAVQDQSPQDILKAADQALYKAKEAGRNRVWEG